jgi:hypothetical protein
MKEPGMRPTAYSFSSNSTLRGKKSMPSRGRGETVTATWTVVSPYFTRAEAEASSAILPTSMVSGRPHRSMVQLLNLGNCLCLMIVDMSILLFIGVPGDLSAL